MHSLLLGALQSRLTRNARKGGGEGEEGENREGFSSKVSDRESRRADVKSEREERLIRRRDTFSLVQLDLGEAFMPLDIKDPFGSIELITDCLATSS